MIIAQISDTHVALDSPDADQRIRDFERTIADINALNPAPDVIVHTGDVVHNGRRDEYAQAVHILSRAKRPVYALVGNKDDRANFRAAFAAHGFLAPGSDFVEYAVENFPVRLIMLDTKSMGSNKGDFCPERARRLIERIDAESTKPIAVFAHHPPFEVTVGPDPLNFETPQMMERLRQALRHSERIVAIFSGHVHRGTFGDVGGIPATVMPSVATSLRRGDYPPHMRNCPVYHVHHFDPVRGFATHARIVADGNDADTAVRDGIIDYRPVVSEGLRSNS